MRERERRGEETIRKESSREREREREREEKIKE